METPFVAVQRYSSIGSIALHALRAHFISKVRTASRMVLHTQASIPWKEFPSRGKFLYYTQTVYHVPQQLP
eukprot:1156514-Pelagomonas_calceolata.AAC.7